MSIEVLSRAFLGRLNYDSDHETDLDRLTALCLGSVATDRRAAREAFLSCLGASLMAFKVRNLPEYHPRCVSGLAEVLRWRVKAIRNDTRTNIAGLAINEWVVDMCPACLGSRIVTDSNGVQRECSLCRGTGKRRYSDEERSEVLGEPAKRHANAIGIAHSGIALAVHVASENAHRMLQEW